MVGYLPPAAQKNKVEGKEEDRRGRRGRMTGEDAALKHAVKE